MLHFLRLGKRKNRSLWVTFSEIFKFWLSALFSQFIFCFSLAVKWLGFEKEKSEDDDDALLSANQDAAQQALLDEVMTAKRAELLLGPRR